MRKNNYGFTLIELLAVITIMGILMLVAIPAVSRTIENSRKDTFIDTVKSYTNSVKTMWAADNLMCGSYTSSSVVPGAYYVEVNTTSESAPALLEQGGKSPWGNRDIMGLVVIAVRGKDDITKPLFYPILVDGIHGVNIKADGSDIEVKKSANSMVRGDIVMSNAAYSIVADKSGETYSVRDVPITVDLNSDGDLSDTVNGVSEVDIPAIKCVER